MKAIIYTRQSKHREESVSHDLQEDACRNFAKSKGWEVIQVFNEKGVSGKTIDKRKEFQSAVDMISNKQADALLVWRWSRFARNTLDGLITLKTIEEEAKGRVECALENIDRSAMGKFSLTMMLGMAELESNVKGEQWKEALERRVSLGLTPGGRNYFGYDKAKDAYSINETEAALLREAFRMYISGTGFNSIAEYFNAQGVSPRRAKHWTGTAIQRMMENPFNIGKFRWKEELIQGSHPAIIDAATWAAFQKKRSGKQLAPRSKSTDDALTSLVFCSLCGKSMSPNKPERGFPIYRCRTRAQSGPSACKGVRVRVSKVKTAVWFWFGGHLQEWLDALPNPESNENDIALAEQTLKNAKEELTSLLLDKAKYSLSDDQIAEAMQVRKDAVEDAESALSGLLAVQGEAPTDIWDKLDQGLENLTPQEWKLAVHRAIAGVIVLPSKEVMVIPK